MDNTYMPTRLRRRRIEANEDCPIDDVRTIWGGGLLVNARFKEVVERFELGVHQFFPIAIEQGGKPQFERYAFYICNRLDTLAKDKCVPPVEEDERWKRIRGGRNKLVYDSEKIGPHHAWHEKYARGHCVSDELYEALKAAELSGFGGKYFEEI